MADRNEITIPEDLIEQIYKGDCVLFTGAGISKGTHGQKGLPDASQVARELALRADFCTAGACWNYDEERGRCRWDSGCVAPFATVTQHYEQERGRQALISYVRDQIDVPGLGPLRAHRLIAELPFSVIISTNWDRMLEEALHRAGKAVTMVINDFEIAFTEPGKVLLLKMHGTADRPDSWVITEEDYLAFFERLRLLVDTLLYFFATKTLLFIGYSLRDPNFRRIYLDITRRLRDKYGRLYKRRAYADTWQPTAYDRAFWERHNLQLIHADATEFLEAVKEGLGD